MLKNDPQFLKIGITLPDEWDKAPGNLIAEADKITELLRSGMIDIFHIRKPSWTKDHLAELISLIPADLHRQLRIHDHFSLLSEFNLGGVQINSRNPVAPPNAPAVSKGIHSLGELCLTECGCYEYVTLSPIYDSISKPGYVSPYPADLTLLKPAIEGRRVIALGGVTPARLSELRDAGFSGAAMLGALW